MDIRQRLKQEVGSYGSAENEAESMEGGGGWHGSGKTGEASLQQRGDWQETQRKTKEAIDR